MMRPSITDTCKKKIKYRIYFLYKLRFSLDSDIELRYRICTMHDYNQVFDIIKCIQFCVTKIIFDLATLTEFFLTPSLDVIAGHFWAFQINSKIKFDSRHGRSVFEKISNLIFRNKS